MFLSSNLEEQKKKPSLESDICFPEDKLQTYSEKS